ncbi:Gfo/Idh/MocA family oxidoreductase [Nocardioides antri]|uniref:Gfo/Idh/MocA family oxidoreductase n=2 Tax=Nocardioides antri TaxID=2607659 RepID=A0A5B1LXD5_9ACTN|nr:Gfo/Idh/MocA family oxidoreductase [Nocardioides antri]
MVGAGGVARRHVATLAGIDGVRITGVVDPARPAAEDLAASAGCPAFGNLAEALDRAAPDAVYICVPPFAHGEPERAVLARGLPFFVEKPVGIDLPDAEDVAARVAAGNVVTGTGYHWRCLDVLDRARALMADGARPSAVAGYWLDKRPPVDWWAFERRSGGQVIEQLTHVLDLARFLLGPATEVYAVEGRGPAVPTDADSTRGDIADSTVATVRFAAGPVATFTATSVLQRKHRAALHTFGPGVVLELSETGLVVDDGESRTQYAPHEDPRVVVDREFVEAVRGEREGTRTPYAEALESHRLACAIARSARTRRPVSLAVDPEGTP